MLRNTIVLVSACLLLSACQREAAPETNATATDSAEPAAPAATAAPTAAFAPIVVEPFGIESCDAFVAAINRCFATAKAHPSAVQILRPPYEQEIQRWRRMMAEPALAKGVEAVCQTQIDALPQAKAGLQCE
jgi:hypothetical protein